MKKLILAAYLTVFAGDTIAQERQNTIVAEVDFGKVFLFGDSALRRPDTVRATMLITTCNRKCIPFTYTGYVVYRSKDTIYLDDRKMVLKAPVKVWMVIKGK